MTLSSLLLFAGALMVVAGAPGPSVAALVSRVIARGFSDVLPFLLAMWFGEAVWLTCAVFGLVVLAETFHAAFVAIKWCGAAYLLWLAYRMWTAPIDEAETAAAPRRDAPWKMFLAGLGISFGNPKVMVFYLALLPTIVDLHTINVAGWAELTLAMIVVLATVDLSWAFAATQARRLLRSSRAVRIANRVGASVMAGAAGAIATR